MLLRLRDSRSHGATHRLAILPPATSWCSEQILEPLEPAPEQKLASESRWRSSLGQSSPARAAVCARGTMDSSREPTQGRLDAAGFWQVWQRSDPDEKGYIEEKELDVFLNHMLSKLGTNDAVMEENMQKVKQQFMATQHVSNDGRIQMKELASIFLSEDENFLLVFRRETPLDSSVEFMQIWRKYDADSSGFISAAELCNFLRDLFVHHKKAVSETKLEEYTGTMMKIFDKNNDGRLDLNDMARILALQENFLLQFKMDACSTEERKRDFEKIFAHYDVSKTGALEGPEVDGFVKDMMELVQPSISGTDLDRFREILLRHCDVNKDGKIQKSELALCLGLKINP
ncbi:secretagogin [Sorex araneus]|uniref:secretagogin n=1 Tax=Sorex araneus TaxID=42254 RepID=UPI002434021E|nr:secretagogin [Sorex araneus]